MKFLLLAVMLGMPLAAAAEDQDVRSLFESGRHEQIVEAVSGMEDPDPSSIYLAALSDQKLSKADAAHEMYGRLASRPDGDAWHFIGLSGQQVVDGKGPAAVASANRAVAADPALPFAHYQAGLAYGQVGDFAKAAAAFAKSSQIDAGFAYAHYHAGVAYSKVKRVDLMATHFEAFLKLAPEAPERAEVESIMRTLRGR